VALATPDPLAAVGTDLLATASPLDRLAVDAGNAGRDRATNGPAEAGRRTSRMRSQVSSCFQASK
jgi:hypothetical protein